MTRSYRVPLVWSRCCQQTHFRPSFTPSSKTVFFASVSHVIWPPSRLNRVVVRTTSPAAPSLIINTSMLHTTEGFGLGAPEVEVPMVPPPLNTKDCQESHGAGDLSDNSAQKCAAYESGNDRDPCGNQRQANIAPRIFPVKHPSQRCVA